MGIIYFFLQNRISVADIIGFGGSEVISSKPEGMHVNVLAYISMSLFILLKMFLFILLL